MLKVFKKLLGGGSNDKHVAKLWPLVEEINSIFPGLEKLSEDELKGKTVEFKARIRETVKEIEEDQADLRKQLKDSHSGDTSGDGDRDQHSLGLQERQAIYEELDKLSKEWKETIAKTLDDMLPEAFAVMKETCRRLVGEEWEAGGSTIKWDMIPYDVQLIGGIVIHQGNIAEMKTGEGKTLVAVAPVYLNALVGNGVHLVTVNPYLAQRDSEWMAPVFGYHGLTVACINKFEPHSGGRREAYRADITYGTNNEFGFDYLRDNSFVIDPDQLVQRPHHFAIVDEVDSVLIDEARTPLIISGPVPNAGEGKFSEYKPYVDRLFQAQRKLVAQLATHADSLYRKRESLQDKKEISALDEEMGLALLRAHRGFARNKKLIKLKAEPGVEQIMRKAEYFYLQDSAKNMHIVDDELYFALDEKMRSIEMSDKGREFIAQTAGTDNDFFIIPDLGEETAGLETWHAEQQKNSLETLNSDTSLTEEKRQNKYQNDRRVLSREFEDKRRELYTLYSERSERIHSVNQLLKAYTLFEKDTEYIVQEGKVQIVDEHTGRVLSGRRYSDGLHQAIEAKENVKIEKATQTYATVTLQNYFRLYEKLAGMTGTAETEAGEFFEIYTLDTVVIPTNAPIARLDGEDLVYRSKREKYNAVIDKIREYNEKGQPVLVGTTSVEVSETLARMLTRAKIKHNVLNAKRDREKSEAHIVAEAGQQGGVTIATNMAGRGTDIKLGPGVKELGGLAIIGTERHDSRRIDLQLRGRAGRQGDPGASQFYVSLEDNLMRLFGNDRTAKIMDRLGLEDGEVISHSMVTKSIERAQKKVEQNNFSIRKRQLEYDDVLNAQRTVVYDRRMHALKGERLRGEILDMIQNVVDEIVQNHYGDGDFEGLKGDLIRMLAFDPQLDQETFIILGEDGAADKIFEDIVIYYEGKRDALAAPFLGGVRRIHESQEENKPEKLAVDFSEGRKVLRAIVGVADVVESDGQELNDALERVAALSTIDEKWTDHLRELDTIKEGIGLRAFGQKDPLLEYKMEAFNAFADMLGMINRDTASIVMKAGPMVNSGGKNQQTKARPRLDKNRAKATHDDKSGYGVKMGSAAAPQQSGADRDPTAKAAPIVNTDRVGRNDPCPCGSGKKYKHCHGRA